MKRNILIIIVIILAGVVVFALVQGIRTGLVVGKETKSPQEKIKEPSVPGEIQVPEDSQKEQAQALSKVEAQLKNQARAFIEQYGTYSSDSGYANLVGLLDFMTDRLRQGTETRIETGIDQSQGFFSIVVKVGSIETISFIEDSRALFTAQTQVQEIRKGETQLSQQIADVVFIKAGDKWLVNSIEFK